MLPLIFSRLDSRAAALFLGFAVLCPKVAAQDPSPAIQDRIPVLIVSGANNHDWPFTSKELALLLEESGRFDVDITTDPAKDLANTDKLAKYRALVLDWNGPRWGDAADETFVQVVKEGMGVVVIHAANNAFSGFTGYETIAGLLWRDGAGHGRFHPFDVRFVVTDHPVTKGMRNLIAHPDELYHGLTRAKGADLQVLAVAHSSKESGGTGKEEPMVAVQRVGKGRVFQTVLGHVWKDVRPSRASMRDPQFRRLVARGTEWAASGAVTLAPSPTNHLSKEERAQGFELLFDGWSNDHWRGFKQERFPGKGWTVIDGCLHHAAGGGGGDLVTKASYADFEFRFEWAVAKGANSGVMWHVTETESTPWQTGPEYQVLDDAGHDGAGVKHLAGSLYDMVAAEGAEPAATGRFNQGRIKVHNGRVEHWLNGLKVVDVPSEGDAWHELIDASKFGEMPRFGRAPTGMLALQDHGDAVWYRSLRVRRLDNVADSTASQPSSKPATKPAREPAGVGGGDSGGGR